jgi:alpha-D-ribose 1-methylphosphonate 5-triphosphate diphosphatase PhnM
MTSDGAGLAFTTITPRIAVNAMDDATSSASAPMTGTTAAIAEFPQTNDCTPVSVSSGLIGFRSN